MAVGEYVGTTYQQIQQAVADYYGSGSDAWARIYAGAGGYYSADAAKVIQQVPGVTVTYSNSGNVLGYSYANPYKAAESAASTINSNVQTGAYGAGSFNNSIPSTVVDNGQGQLVGQSGSRLAATGATVATIMDRFCLAAIGVSVGTKLGKAIDSAIYSIDPQWWDTHLPGINPETWDSMATTQAGKQFIQGLFALDGDNTTMYLDERLLAQVYQVLLEEGAFTTPDSGVVNPEDIPEGFPDIDTNITYSINTTNEQATAGYGGNKYFIRLYRPAPSAILLHDTVASSEGTTVYTGTGTSYEILMILDDSQWYYSSTYSEDGSGWTDSPVSIRPSTYTFNGQTVKYYRRELAYGKTSLIGGSAAGDRYGPIAWLIKYKGTPVSPSITGISDDPRAQTHIDPRVITGTTPEEVLQELKTNYPDLFNDSIYQDVPQPDGTVDRINYVPVPVPDGVTTSTPTTGEASQVNPSVNPDDNTDSMLESLIQILTHPETEPQIDIPSDTPPDTPIPPDTGDGATPIVTPIAGSASSLWKIYNPSQAEIDSFGAWLWSSDFIDQIKKLFNDPMQAIIGVHKVFCTPAVGGRTTIKCGYLDSEVPSNWVSNQYTHIDCGTVNLPEYFGNVFDYDPFTRVSLFIPCVGIVPLDVAEVMRSSITVKLHCDVLTGALLAEVNVIRDQSGGILYTYSGSCIVTYPVSSGTYMGAVANVVSVAASVAAGIMGTVASGGALAPAVVGAAGAAVSGLAHTRTNVQHSGAFSGAAGVMGGKIPYLIITRPQTRMANKYPEYDGVPANFTSRLGDCTGYVKVKEVHLKVADAYESEIAEIENLLHQGVLI